MPDEFDYQSSKDRFNQRREQLRTFVSDINRILDSFTSVPETENDESIQREAIRRDLYKVEDRIIRYRSEL